MTALFGAKFITLGMILFVLVLIGWERYDVFPAATALGAAILGVLGALMIRLGLRNDP
jgi:putative Mn2+ efflux pump MntP